MKTKVTFTTHYFGQQMSIMMDAEKAQELISNPLQCGPEAYIAEDKNRIIEGVEPLFFTKSQLQRLSSFNSESHDYFDSISLQ